MFKIVSDFFYFSLHFKGKNNLQHVWTPLKREIHKCYTKFLFLNNVVQNMIVIVTNIGWKQNSMQKWLY